MTLEEAKARADQLSIEMDSQFSVIKLDRNSTEWTVTSTDQTRNLLRAFVAYTTRRRFPTRHTGRYAMR